MFCAVPLRADGDSNRVGPKRAIPPVAAELLPERSSIPAPPVDMTSPLPSSEIGVWTVAVTPDATVTRAFATMRRSPAVPFASVTVPALKTRPPMSCMPFTVTV